MNTKYDWSNVPDWVNWIFMYENTVWCSNLKPRVCEFTWGCWRYSGDGFKCEKIKCDAFFNGDWQDSLEERPK